MENCSCSVLTGKGLDIETPRNAVLTAYYKRSFAHHTVKNRMPVIITQIIDGLVRNKEDIAETYGLESMEDLKKVIGELSKLKYEIQTNKSLSEISMDCENAGFYNKYLKEQLDKNATCTFFNAIWLHAECYMYEKVHEIFCKTQYLDSYDPFRKQKKEAFESALPLITTLGKNLLEIVNSSDRNDKADFRLLMKLNLWGNKCDLSLSNGEQTVSDANLLKNIDDLDAKILCNQTDEVWDAINEESIFELIDIVFDNAGYELFTDLCLADFLITRNFAQDIRLYVKTIPWFISDVTKHDLEWMLQRMAKSDDANLQNLAERWTEYISTCTWDVREDAFWTLPVSFSEMQRVDDVLYKRMARAKVCIFKGDLNYRKLFGETNWDPVKPVVEALQGFHPTRVCSIRTLKSDIICGLEAGVAEDTAMKDKDWLINGEYGVIQFCGKVVRQAL